MSESQNYIDDLSITDEADLWRRIHPKQVVPDKNTGQLRPSSAAFQNSTNNSPMSILIAEIVLKSDRDTSDVLSSYPGFSLAVFTAGIARKCNQGVKRDALPDEQAHGLVFGKKTPGVRRKLAELSKWVVLNEKAS